MPRPPRRGKNPRETKESVAQATIPSTVLQSILRRLDLTFERDIGMLNGKNTHAVPDRDTLLKVQEQLNLLKDLFETISKDDQEYIDKIRSIREDRVKAEQKAKADAIEADAKIEVKKEEPAESDNDKTESIQDNVENNAPKRITVDQTEVETTTQTDVNEIAEQTTEEPNKKRPLEIEDEEATEEKTDEKEPQNDNNDEQPTSSTNDEKAPEEKAEPITTEKNENNDEPALKKQKTEEVDIDQMENNPNVKNPKSEFVISQTLPRAARSLGLFSEEGLESTGEDYLKKKYSVASYPTTDLKELLPGDLPDMDLSCAKPANQIQYSTFLSYVDNFFKGLTDDDIKFLKAKYILPENLEIEKSYDPEVTPFVIPKLGPLYTRTWMKADANKNLGNTSPPHVTNDASSVVAKKSGTDIKDSSLENEDISCGPLLSRLMSAIFRDEGNDLARQITAEQSTSGIEIFGTTPTMQSEAHTPATDNLEIENKEQTPLHSVAETPLADIEEITKFSIGGTTSTLKMDQGWKINNINLDYPTLEERLKRELKYVGIYMNMPKDENNPNGVAEPDWVTGREDDEVSAELRELQSSLKQATARNQKRKEILIPLVERQLAWSEYSSILEDLDKQVDQAYIKRIRVPKKRKKHHGNSVNAATASQIAQQKAANSSLKALLDKRQRWITKIGPLFGPSEIMKRIPKKSVFSNLEQEEDDDDADVFDQNHEGKDEDLEA